MTTRREDWPQRMNDAIDAARDTPFVWGGNDCFQFSCAVVRAMTDSDYAADLAGYSTERGALKLIKKLGFDDLAAAATARLGEPLASVLLAQRGDVLMHQAALGICVGEHGAFLTLAGMVFVRVMECECAWRIE